jgi:hypothetical protein
VVDEEDYRVVPWKIDDLDPVTVTPDRYGGTYSGGAWLAFPCDPHDVPEEPSYGDNAAAAWWQQAGDFPIGRGRSATDAYEDLVRRLEAVPPTRRFPPTLGQHMWTWDLEWPSGRQSEVSRLWGRGRNRSTFPRVTSPEPVLGI